MAGIRGEHQDSSSLFSPNETWVEGILKITCWISRAGAKRRHFSFTCRAFSWTSLKSLTIRKRKLQFSAFQQNTEDTFTAWVLIWAAVLLTVTKSCKWQKITVNWLCSSDSSVLSSNCLTNSFLQDLRSRCSPLQEQFFFRTLFGEDATDTVCIKTCSTIKQLVSSSWNIQQSNLKQKNHQTKNQKLSNKNSDQEAPPRVWSVVRRTFYKLPLHKFMN